MAGTAWPFNETGTSGVPAVTARQLRQLHSPFVAMGSTARPLGAKSGLRVGTPSTCVSITGSGPYGWSVVGIAGLLDGEANAAAGAYLYSFDTAQTGSIVASGAAARVDMLSVQVSDSDEGDSSGTKAVQIVYTQGAATGGQPPTAPARSHRIGYINVPTSGAPTFTFAPEWAGDAGEWTFNTKAELDTYTTVIGASNVPVNQRATVIADSTTSNNGDWVRSGTTWVRIGASALYDCGQNVPANTPLTYTATPNPLTVPSYMSGLVIPIAGGFQIVRPGMFSFGGDVTITLGAALQHFTNRVFLDVLRTGQTKRRVSMPVSANEDTMSWATAPELFAAGDQIGFTYFQQSGATYSFVNNVTVAYLG